MPTIDQLKFGSITVDGQRFGQVIIVDGKIYERDSGTLENEFGTTHRISHEEGDELLESDPEYIIIGDGFNGVLKVQSEILEFLQKTGVKILVLHSPAAVKKYNELIKQGRRVNLLIHTTC
ncbi:MAG: hypothetical protein HW405_80 [Candidatus Berkelbacteria bacterium]|nr:hypothetical protein [Candidatus Berkelbacteria bacterium]